MYQEYYSCEETKLRVPRNCSCGERALLVLEIGWWCIFEAYRLYNSSQASQEAALYLRAQVRLDPLPSLYTDKMLDYMCVQSLMIAHVQCFMFIVKG